MKTILITILFTTLVCAIIFSSIVYYKTNKKKKAYIKNGVNIDTMVYVESKHKLSNAIMRINSLIPKYENKQLILALHELAYIDNTLFNEYNTK